MHLKLITLLIDNLYTQWAVADPGSPPPLKKRGGVTCESKVLA